MPIAASEARPRVKDSTTTTGTGNVTLSGTAPTGYQDFNTAFGTNIRFYYVIAGGAEWEEGQGYLSASTTLVRETVLYSSNANAAVSFSAGTKDVFCAVSSYEADKYISRGRVVAIGTFNALP